MNLLFSLTIPICSLIAPANAFSTCHVASTLPRSPVNGLSRRLTSQLRSDGTNGDSEAESTSAPEDSTASEGESDIMNSPAFLRKKAEVLKSDIEAVEKEIEETNAAYLEGKEEWGSKFEDLEKESLLMGERMSRQSREASMAATQDVGKKMVELLDNYDRAFGSISASSDEEEGIAEDYKNTYGMIIDTLVGFNVTKIETVGAEFDFELHQGVMQMPSEYPEGTVCQELQPGWVMGDRLIRPAMVAVSA